MRAFASLVGAAALGLATPSMADVEAVSEQGFVTRDVATLAATPRQVWLALIKPADWWNDDHTWSGDAANLSLVPSAGGCFCEAIPGEGDIPLDGSARHAVVVQAIPDKALRLRGGLGPLQAVPATGVLTISLEEIEGGTKVTWEYNVGGQMGFEIDAISKAVDGVMSQQLRGLSDLLGTLPGNASSRDDS
ncbi:SRPBCC family protein [Erythrobacter vulgaris]|uniref:SRPBCC family protein n=1 Tax=Qipengyuania vulgaris TaxID=291985 RepID=A0A844XVU1_9SPHN|nr:SRPBCC domain-containing protein [Qipengyuania vulgaris]MXO49078.1 SRPBCC family protein [Qipengyuania vulgaris]